MTDKKLIEVAHIECSKLLKSEKGYDGISSQEFWAEGYKKGLEEGKPKWHDLRKNPDDLPEEDRECLCLASNCYFVGYYDKDDEEWHFDEFCTNKIKAWCELPKFEEV